jgi:agmatinase
MKIYNKQYLGNEVNHTSFKDAKAILIPFCYEGGLSYGKGASRAPDAIIDASQYLELYDEVLDTEPYSIGICTVVPPEMPSEPENMVQVVYQTTREVLDDNKFVVSLGGDHSVSTGFCKALLEKYEKISVIQIDAHADLRHSYEGSIFSHASVMSRIREMTKDTLQIGIRSLSAKEAQLIKDEQLVVCSMDRFRKGSFDLDSAIQNLPDPVFITFDLDVFDWSVIRSTGTPEPGGLLWDEAMNILQKIFSIRDVVGFDVVELAPMENDPNSSFAAAKLIYKMIGFKYFLHS